MVHKIFEVNVKVCGKFEVKIASHLFGIIKRMSKGEKTFFIHYKHVCRLFRSQFWLLFAPDRNVA